MEKMRRTKPCTYDEELNETPDIKLDGDELKDFQRYQKLKTAIIIWNLTIASVSFFVFFVTIWRIVSGNREPWLFKYCFPHGKIYDAVHSVEGDYFPKTLTYVDMIYIVAPVYSTILYASNAFTIAVSISMKNYHYLKATKNISAAMSIPVIILIGIFGK